MRISTMPVPVIRVQLPGEQMRQYNAAGAWSTECSDRVLHLLSWKAEQPIYPDRRIPDGSIARIVVERDLAEGSLFSGVEIPWPVFGVDREPLPLTVQLQANNASHRTWAYSGQTLRPGPRLAVSAPVPVLKRINLRCAPKRRLPIRGRFTIAGCRYGQIIVRCSGEEDVEERLLSAVHLANEVVVQQGASCQTIFDVRVQWSVVDVVSGLAIVRIPKIDSVIASGSTISLTSVAVT